MSPSNATKLLCAMGLSSVPTWLRPFNVLSNGEKYRATIAMQIAKAKEGEIVYIDEFTSVVDRNVAKAMSNSLQKYARRNNLKIVLASCHYDIIEWLECDWMFDLNKGGVLERGDRLRQGRPQIPLRMYRVEPSAWRIFAKHHYMTQELNESSACYVFAWGTQLVAFVGVLPMPSGTIRNAVRGTRTVVLPDFQGLGIGSRVTSFVASIYKNEGYRYYTKTVNPALGEFRNHSRDWKATGFNGKLRENGLIDKNGRHYLSRVSYCHEYVGAPTSGFGDLIRPIEKMRYDKSMEGQLSLF